MTDPELESEWRPFVCAAMGRKAMEPVVLDVRRITDVTDAFIICSGRSNRQVSAIAEFIESELKKKGIRPLGIEGVKDGQWALIDYGHVVIHVFYEPVRRFYDLESLWADARCIEVLKLPEFAELSERTENINE